jgi:hypothetical protein
MPRLATLLEERRASAADREPAGSPMAAPGEGAAEVDMGELLGSLALGAGMARKAINRHAFAARSVINRSAKRSSKKLEDQTTAAGDAVRALTGQRHIQLDKTLLAHRTEINTLEKTCNDDAAKYANNAKAAQKDGFTHYRGQLANVFDHWSRNFDLLNKRKSDDLVRGTAANVKRMWSKYAKYVRVFIRDVGGQSDARRDVQSSAAMEVLESYIKEFEKTNTEVLPEIAKACERVKTEINKGREEALAEFDKGLPLVLKGIDDQLAAALPHIRKKAGEARDVLTLAAIQMHARVHALERISLEHHATFRTKVDGEIESGRAGAERQFQRATPEAMEPIAATIDEAVGVLTSTDDELDPDASQQFVDEVVDFSLGAADATGEVFAAARDASVGTLADAVPFARRGFAAGKKDLQTTLHDDSVEDETCHRSARRGEVCPFAADRPRPDLQHSGHASRRATDVHGDGGGHQSARRDAGPAAGHHQGR